MILLKCKQCGSEELTRDATAIWDPHEEDWVLAGIQDAITCEHCGYVSKSGQAAVEEVEDDDQ